MATLCQHPSQGAHEAFYEWYCTSASESGTWAIQQVGPHALAFSAGDDGGDRAIGAGFSKEVLHQRLQEIAILADPNQGRWWHKSLQEQGTVALVGVVVALVLWRERYGVVARAGVTHRSRHC